VIADLVLDSLRQFENPDVAALLGVIPAP